MNVGEDVTELEIKAMFDMKKKIIKLFLTCCFFLNIQQEALDNIGREN